MPPRHFAESDAAAGNDRKANGGDQLVGFAGRGQHVLLERAGGEHARAALRAQHDLAFEDSERQRNFRTGIGMRDRAADRAFVAGLEMADEGQGSGEERQLVGEIEATPTGGSA